MPRASGFAMSGSRAVLLNGPTVNHLVYEIRTQHRAYMSPGYSITFWISPCGYESSDTGRHDNVSAKVRNRKLCERCNIATEYDMIMAPKPKVVI